MRYFSFAGDRKRRRGLAVLLCAAFSLILLCGILAVFPTAEDAGVYSQVIRLHVIANSDSEQDQALKLTVRDAVIEQYRETLSSFSSKEEAEKGVTALLPEISECASKVLSENGSGDRCTAMLGTEYYGRTVYEGLTMPQGNYTSLRLVIGEGKGHNWWCVLFPPMCTRMAIAGEDETETDFIEAGFTREQYRLITGNDQPRYRIRFRLLELLFGGSAE